MGSSMFGYTDKNGKNWDPITLSPPKTISCPHCGAKVTTTSAKCMNPLIHCYRCTCGRETQIQDTDTIEHWPDDVVAEYKAGLAQWAADGHPIKEEIGEVIFNTRGITQIKID